MSIRPLDEQKCPLDNQMSIRPLDEHKCPLLAIQMSICPLAEQKCPVDIQMSIGHSAEVLDMYETCSSSQFFSKPRIIMVRGWRWTLLDGKHFTFLSAWGHAPSYYIIAPSLTL